MPNYKNATEWYGFQPKLAKISMIHFTNVVFGIYGNQPIQVKGIIQIEDQVSIKDVSFNYLNNIAGFNPGEFILRRRETEIINKQIADMCSSITINVGNKPSSKSSFGERIAQWLNQKG